MFKKGGFPGNDSIQDFKANGSGGGIIGLGVLSMKIIAYMRVAKEALEDRLDLERVAP